MANASQKRIAIQNEKAVKNLRLGMIIPTLLHFIFRFLLRRSSLPPSKGSLGIYAITYIPTLLLARYLAKIGTTRRDASGTLISSGEDLNQAGITEWCFDIIYVTWTCQVGSGAFGERFWYFWLVIPLYAGIKIWNNFISPMVLGRSPAAARTEEPNEKEALSKRQEKLRKKSERGDPRIKVGKR